MSVITSKINKEPVQEYKIELAWRNILAFIYLHGAAIYACTISKYYSTYVIGNLFLQFFPTILQLLRKL